MAHRQEQPITKSPGSRLKPLEIEYFLEAHGLLCFMFMRRGTFTDGHPPAGCTAGKIPYRHKSVFLERNMRSNPLLTEHSSLSGSAACGCDGFSLLFLAQFVLMQGPAHTMHPHAGFSNRMLSPHSAACECSPPLHGAQRLGSRGNMEALRTLSKPR